VTDYVAEANKATEQYLATLAKAQEEYVKAVETFVKQVPALPKPAVELPAVELPIDLPKAQDVTAAGFDFAEKALAQYRVTTDKLVALVPAV